MFAIVISQFRYLCESIFRKVWKTQRLQTQNKGNQRTDRDAVLPDSRSFPRANHIAYPASAATPTRTATAATERLLRYPPFFEPHRSHRAISTIWVRFGTGCKCKKPLFYCRNVVFWVRPGCRREGSRGASGRRFWDVNKFQKQ